MSKIYNVTSLIKILNEDNKNLLISFLNNEIEINSNYIKNYNYMWNIKKNKFYDKMGVFYDYFIRLYLSYINKIKFDDMRSELIISNRFPKDYDEDPESYEPIDTNLKTIRKCYKDISSDIIKDKNLFISDYGISLIWNASQLHFVFFGEETFELNKNEIFTFVDKQNIIELIYYLNKNFINKNIICNPIVGCEYFNGDADLIIDDVLIDFKCSWNADVTKHNFIQLLIYAFGYYKRNQKKINKLIIFNPLLGIEYILNININFDELENIFLNIKI